MSEQEYLEKINSYNSALSSYQVQLKKLKDEIDEAESALSNAHNYSDKFYSALERKRKQSSKLRSLNGLRLLLSWSENLTSIFTDSRFYQADRNVQDMIENIKQELNRLYEEYDNCEAMICKTRRIITDTQGELNLYRIQEMSKEEG